MISFSSGWKDDPQKTELSFTRQFHSTNVDYIALKFMAYVHNIVYFPQATHLVIKC